MFYLTPFMEQAYTNILICGGSGFMGSHFVRHLYDKYDRYRIYNLDLLTYAGNPDNLKDIASKESLAVGRYQFIHGDIGDKALLEDLFSKVHFDVVINFAAESHVDRSIVNSVEFIRTNIQGAYVLMEVVRRYKIPRFVYISTDEVYGNIPENVFTPETHPLLPTNPYAGSKASADLMVQTYMKTHRLPAVIIRSSNNYGSHQYPEKLHALTITNLIENKKIPVHGNGLHKRSWLHVEDFCNAVDLMMHKADDYSIYNVSGEERTNLQVIKTIMMFLGKNPNEYLSFVNDRPGPDLRYAPDDHKIRQELGWERTRTYNEAIRELIKWYQANTEWWQKIRQRKDFTDHYSEQIKGYYSFEEHDNVERKWTISKK